MEALHYLVWRKNGGWKPRFKHPTLESAMTEANRLATETGAKILVLAVVAEVAPDDFSKDQA